MKTHELLKTYIAKNRKSSPGFSVRSLARRVGVSAPFLSRVLNGQKPLPEGLFKKLVATLNVEPELFDLQPRRRRRVPVEAPASLDEWQIAENDTNRILRSWFYLPVLECTTLANFEATNEAIATKLGLTLAATQAVTSELSSLGLLRQVDDRYQKVHEKIRFTGSKSMAEVRRFHSEMLRKAEDELRLATAEEDRARRLISGMTISATPEAVRVAKNKLNDVLHEIANELTAQPGTEVYHLAVQLFPLTKK